MKSLRQTPPGPAWPVNLQNSKLRAVVDVGIATDVATASHLNATVCLSCSVFVYVSVCVCVCAAVFGARGATICRLGYPLFDGLHGDFPGVGWFHGRRQRRRLFAPLASAEPPITTPMMATTLGRCEQINAMLSSSMKLSNPAGKTLDMDRKCIETSLCDQIPILMKPIEWPTTNRSDTLFHVMQAIRSCFRVLLCTEIDT